MMLGAVWAVGNPPRGCPRDCGQPVIGLSRALGAGCGQRSVASVVHRPSPSTGGPVRPGRTPATSAPLRRLNSTYTFRPAVSFMLTRSVPPHSG